MAVRTPDPNPGWLSEDDLDFVRGRLPILYVQAVPVRVDECGEVTRFGLLLQGREDGVINRSVVSGRVLHGESLRSALQRHLEKDLGPLAMPHLPQSLHPFTVTEYFPVPGIGPFHDPRQHAVALCYIVPIRGELQPRKDALEVTWFTPEELLSSEVQAEVEDSQGLLMYQAMAHLGIFTRG